MFWIKVGLFSFFFWVCDYGKTTRHGYYLETIKDELECHTGQ